MHQRLLPLFQPQRVVGNIVLGNMAPRLLREVGKGGHDGFFTDRIGITPVSIFATKSREFTDCTQEPDIGVFRRCHLG